MAKLKQINRAETKALGAAIEEALQGVAEKYGVSIKRGNGSYTGTSASIKVEIALISEDGTVLTREAEDFKRYASLFGLKPEDFGAKFRSNGKEFKLVGLKPNSPKFPILGEEIGTGRKFKFTEAAVSTLKVGHKLEDRFANR